MTAFEIIRKNLLRLLRGKKQLGIAAKASEMGMPIDQRYISSLKAARFVNPTLKKLDALAAGLEVDVEELFRPLITRVKPLTWMDVCESKDHAELHQQLQIILDAGGEDVTGIKINLKWGCAWVKKRRHSAEVNRLEKVLPVARNGPKKFANESPK